MADFRSRFPQGRLARRGRRRGVRRAGARRSSLRSALRSFGDRGATFCPIVVSSRRPRAAEGGGLPRRSAKDDRTTRRQDRPRAPSGRGGRFLVVPSARRLVVLPPRKGATVPATRPSRSSLQRVNPLSSRTVRKVAKELLPKCSESKPFPHLDARRVSCDGFGSQTNKKKQ